MMGRKLTLRDDLIPLVESFQTLNGDETVGSAMNRLIYYGLISQGMITPKASRTASTQQKSDDDLELLGGIDL